MKIYTNDMPANTNPVFIILQILERNLTQIQKILDKTTVESEVTWKNVYITDCFDRKYVLC